MRSRPGFSVTSTRPSRSAATPHRDSRVSSRSMRNVPALDDTSIWDGAARGGRCPAANAKAACRVSAAMDEYVVMPLRACATRAIRFRSAYFRDMTPAAQLEQYRPALTGHCYRMLGSVMEAEDAVQEAMLRAWKAMDKFEQQSSLKTWLYRIATNVCLDSLASSERKRVRPLEF